MVERIIASFIGYICALGVLKLGCNFVKYIKDAPNRKKSNKGNHGKNDSDACGQC